VNVLAIHLLLFFAAFSVGWIVPLVIGIKRVKTRQGGVGLVVLGGVWGFFGVLGSLVGCLAFFGFRSMERASECTDFDPSSYEGATGTIVALGEGELTLRVRSSRTGEQYVLRGTNGVLVAPAERLAVARYRLSSAGSDGITWQASAYSFNSDSRTITVPEKGRVELKIGPPLCTKVETRPFSDGRRSFDLSITGRGGNRFTVRAHGKKSILPGFEVLSDTGEVVWSGKFAYG